MTRFEPIFPIYVRQLADEQHYILIVTKLLISAKLVCGQILDVNMVNEPKEHVTKLKATKRKVQF